ncbi:uncharacterized protein N7482_002071 [Penicillium canariense]|uniref:Uncharacterized protein n=1 Tax=Penicillium canariense TaxID=189055 RepID=A0A9W9LUH3_9EURO|nr:uncharacterized protein N7482_002071 [Penicillium canariense]KAJ5176194.1 hypothetical protein N7482_002071 [Penicillium canariense]
MEATPITSTPLPKDTSFASAASPYFDSLFHHRQQKKMSITQTYYLAHTARKKLTREASRADHDLRLLVGHANMLDSLMLDLADAEREQERWFNQTVTGAAKTSSQHNDRAPHVQWASTSAVAEEAEEDWDAENESDLDSDLSDSDEEDDSDYDENDFVINKPVRLRSPPPPQQLTPTPEAPLLEDEDDDTDSDFEYDDVEDLEELSLTRSPSRQSPPELLADSSDSSDDEGMPPSPPQPALETFDQKEPVSTAIPLADDQAHLFEPGYYVSQEQSTIIEAF